MNKHLFTNIGKLALFILRRDRYRLPIWIMGIVFFTLIVPPALNELYPSQQDRDAFALTMENPAMIAMSGPADFENYTIGVMTTQNMLIFTALVVGLMSILIVNRHTRSDEEDGRLEMILSLPVGRLATMNATFLVMFITHLVLTIVIAFGLVLLNLESIDMEGSLLYGATLGGTGVFFAALTALFAQISVTSRGTVGYSITILLLAYLVRAIGDVSNEVLSWVSPLGWVIKAQVFSENNWWPVFTMVLTAIIIMILANYLNSIRDLEAGFLKLKAGRKYATKLLQTPTGLILRLSRNGMLAWAIGMFVLGASYGSVLGDLDAFFQGSEVLMQMIMTNEEQSIIDQFMPMLLVVIAIMSTIPPVMSMLKLYGEEKKNRSEHLLARAVSRTELMITFFIISVANAFIMLSLSAIGLWSSGVIALDGDFNFSTVYGAAIVHLPAVIFMISVAAMLIGFMPKFSNFVWLYVFYSFIVLYLGGLFQFSDWVGNLSPFGHIPQVPVEEMEIMPILVLITLSLFLFIIGNIGYNRRDIQ